MNEKTKHKYYIWITNLIKNSQTKRYKRLYDYLHDYPYRWTDVYDENRAYDGFALRERFGLLNDIPIEDIYSWIDDDPCSLFEMMVGLAFRCEETIMEDFDKGDRTETWFRVMTDSMGLSKFTNTAFSTAEIDFIVERMLNKEYAADGNGGLFYIPNCDKDLREYEIWYQLSFFLQWYTEEGERYGKY